MLPCFLCHHASHPLPARVRGRQYHDCPNCRLIFMDPQDRLPCEAERAHYRMHNNDPADPAYRRFLRQLADPLMSRLTPGMKGLDFGCGPGPTLSVMLAEAGFEMAVYDPAFADNRAVLDDQYDFVTCTETVEHFHDPRAEWERLHQLVRPGGLLAVMTQPISPDVDFANWWYALDPTHVSLHHPATMDWIAEHWHMTVDRVGETVWIFKV